jgi:hypothetical protein
LFDALACLANVAVTTPAEHLCQLIDDAQSTPNAILTFLCGAKFPKGTVAPLRRAVERHHPATVIGDLLNNHELLVSPADAGAALLLAARSEQWQTVEVLLADDRVPWCNTSSPSSVATASSAWSAYKSAPLVVAVTGNNMLCAQLLLEPHYNRCPSRNLSVNMTCRVALGFAAMRGTDANLRTLVYAMRRFGIRFPFTPEQTDTVINVLTHHDSWMGIVKLERLGVVYMTEDLVATILRCGGTNVKRAFSGHPMNTRLPPVGGKPPVEGKPIWCLRPRVFQLQAPAPTPTPTPTPIPVSEARPVVTPRTPIPKVTLTGLESAPLIPPKGQWFRFAKDVFDEQRKAVAADLERTRYANQSAVHQILA